MPPRTSNPSPTPAAAATSTPNETRKTADALWLFEQFLHCDPPIILNVTPIAETTGMKPNTIVKRVNTMQHRYPGFGIVTRTTGARQSSNLVTGTLVTPVKKAAGKEAGRGSRGKKVGIVEEDEEHSGKKQTRGKKRGERGVSSTKIKTDEGDQTQASTHDDDSDQPLTPPIKKPSKKTKPQKKSTSKQTSPDSFNNDTDASEQIGIEEETPAKKIATPKTRGGRKSAGIGEIKALRAYPEKPVPRGRHAIPKKEKVADADIMQDDAVASDFENAMKKDADKVPNGNKRKRPETSEPQSSPLTPSPAIKQRLAEMDSTKKGEKEGNHANKLDSSEMPPPSKKQRKNPDTNGDNIDTETTIQKASSPATPEIAQAQPDATTSQDETSTKVEGSQSVTDAVPETALYAGPNTAAEPEQDVDHSMTTPLGQNIDEIPDASNEAGDSGEHTAEVDQVMEAPESPTADRGKPIKSATETFTKLTAVSNPTPNADASTSEEAALRAKVIREAETLPDQVESGVEEPGSTTLPNNIKDTTKNTNTQEPEMESTETEALNNADNPVIPEASRSIHTEHGQDPKESGQSKSKKQFSQPLEWMIWNPTAKPSKSEYAPKVGRILP